MVVKVYGKLNDQEIILEHIEKDKWNVKVPRVKEGRYYVDLFALDEAGNVGFLATALFTIDANCTCVDFKILDDCLVLKEDHIHEKFMLCKCNQMEGGTIVNRALKFLQGEVRKLVMEVSCDCDEDFIISTAKAELIKSDEEIIELPLHLDIDCKKLAVIIDTNNLDGYYKLLITYDINDETLKKKLDVRVS